MSGEIQARATSGPPKPPGPWAALNRILDKMAADIRSAFARLDAVEARPAAKNGEPGRDGRGIAAARLVDGSLVIAYSDGTEANLGRVVTVGPAGNGIRDAQVDDSGRLLLTLDDGRVMDAGEVRGAPGHDITDEHVAAAVATYLAVHPPAPGPKGDPGCDAEQPTDEQIGAAVARYLQANPPPKGDKRDPGESIKGDPGQNADESKVVALAASCDALASRMDAIEGNAADDADVAALKIDIAAAQAGAEQFREAAERATAAAERAQARIDALEARPPAVDVAVIDHLAGDIEALKAAPKGIASFLIDAAGDLIAVKADGTQENIGRVRGVDGVPGEDATPPAGIVAAGITEGGRLTLTLSDGRTLDAGEVRGRKGDPGAPAPVIPGPAGRSITTAKVSEDGHLLLTFTDGMQEDAGLVALRGEEGKAGRSVVTAGIVDGDLVLDMSDGEVIRAGRVTGRDGADAVGIRSAAIIDGDLTITLSDGKTQTLGRVVGTNGRPGKKGDPGESPELPVTIDEPEYIGLTADKLGRLRARRMVIDGTEMTVLVLAD